MPAHTRNESPSQPARQNAFTLAELLTVATAVGLLIAIVQPSLLAAREASKLSVCLERLRDIAQATSAYTAADPAGFALPVHSLQLQQDPVNPTFIGAYEWGGKSGAGRNDWVPEYAGSPHGSKYGTAAGFGPATRPLNKFLYPHGFRDNGSVRDGNFNRIAALSDLQLQLDKFRCPADDGPPGGAHCPDWLDHPRRPSFDHFGNSYAANLFLVWAAGGTLGPGFKPSEMGSNSPSLRPASRIPSPVRTITYEENIGRWAWAARRERCDGSLSGLDLSPGVDPGPTGAVRGWHDKDWTFTRAFADTHAERQKVYIEGTEDQEGFAYHYRNETVFPEDPQRDQSVACIVIRGPGWQKDTLPAPYLPTNMLHAGLGRPSYEDCVTNE